MGTDELGEAARSGGPPLTVRAFFGLPLPDRHRAALDAYLHDCAGRAPLFRWTPAENLHLTVRFLGHVEEALANGVASRVADAAPAGFELALGELGTFNSRRLARVVWIGLAAGAPACAELAALVEAECVRAGLEPETRPLRAHLTLARARPREGSPLPELAEPPALPAWRATGLILYRSRLGRGGSVYEPLREVALS